MTGDPIFLDSPSGSWLRKSWRRVAVLMLTAVVVGGAYVVKVRHDFIDFEVDYRAAGRFLAGEDLYRTTDGHMMYRYLPGGALLESPMGLLPIELARPLFYVLLVGCLGASLVLSSKMVSPEPRVQSFLRLLGVLVLAKYFAREIDLGQINLIITVLLLGAIEQLARPNDDTDHRRQVLAGAAWGAAALLKPYALIVSPYLVATRRWKCLVAGLVTIALFSFAPVFRYGLAGTIELHSHWAATQLQPSMGLLTDVDNTSLLGFFVRSTGDRQLGYWLYFGAALGLAALTLKIIRAGRDLPQPVILEGALLLSLIPLLAPLGWEYVNLMAVLTVMLLIHRRFSLPRPWRYLLVTTLWMIGLTISSVIGHPLHTLYEAYLLTTINFVTLIGLLAGLRLRRAC